MILQRIRTFDGIQVIPKNICDNILFNHCTGKQDVMDSQIPWIVEILQAHGVGNVVIEDGASVIELNTAVDK